MWKEIREWAVAILIALVVVIVVKQFLFTQYVVDGRSMAPTFQDSDRVLVNKLSYNLHDIEHGDVIVFNSNEDDVYIKRIVGIPGDKVEMVDKEVYINGEPIEEDYVSYKEDSYKDNFKMEDFGIDGEIPKDSYLVLGDNRPVSKDSRAFGLVDKDAIIGKVMVRFWPLSEFSTDFSH